MRKLAVCAVAVTLAGCATAPANITPTYVNPAEFSSLSCETMATEYATLSENLDEMVSRQQANSDADTALTAGGMVLLWPLLIGLAFTPDEEEEIAMMMGQAEALESSSQAAGCPVAPPDSEAPVVVESGPTLVDGRELRGTFDGTPYEPETEAGSEPASEG